MTHPVPTATRDQAMAGLRSASRRGRPALFVAILSGIATVVAFAYVADDPAAGAAWSALLIAGAVFTLSAWATRAAMARVRYRITGRYSAALLAVKLAAAIAGLVALGVAVDALGLSVRRGLGPVVVAAVVLTLMHHLATSTLLQGGAQGLILRRTTLPWDDVAAVVVAAGARPGTTEVGVRARPGTRVAAMPMRAGEAMSDLPYRTVVPTRALRMDRLHWAINQSGRTDIVVLERSRFGERVLLHANRPY